MATALIDLKCYTHPSTESYFRASENWISEHKNKWFQLSYILPLETVPDPLMVHPTNKTGGFDAQSLYICHMEMTNSITMITGSLQILV